MAERDEHQQSSGCSACEQLGQMPTQEHLAGVARFEARQQQLNKISLRHGVVGGEHCGAFEPQCDASWLLDEVAALRRQWSDDSAVADAAIAHHTARADKVEAENARLRERVAALEVSLSLADELARLTAWGITIPDCREGCEHPACLILRAIARYRKARAALAGQEQGGAV